MSRWLTKNGTELENCTTRTVLANAAGLAACDVTRRVRNNRKRQLDGVLTQE